jgi:hypothetical protein
MTLRQGTIVDATLIAEPSSTNNKEGKRDSEMHQTKKGNQWYFGMKVHAGVDKDSGLIHSVVCTAANVHDLTQLLSCCMAMRGWCTATLATRASPNDPRWQATQWSSGLQRAQASAERCPTLQRECCRI